MLIQTHHQMAKVVHHHIKSSLGLELNSDKLRLGSIIPDLNWRYLQIPHYFAGGFSFYCQQLEGITREAEIIDLKDFSRRLGIILHFTADFFCSAHNDQELINSIWPHLNYELKLNQAFLQTEAEPLHIPAFKHPASLILNLRKRYLEQPSNIPRDCQYIHTACLELSRMLVARILIPAVSRAA